MRYQDATWRSQFTSMHYANCGLIQASYQGDNPSPIDKAYPDLIQVGDTEGVIQEGDRNCKVRWLYDATDCLIICNGITTPRQVPNMINGWLSGAVVAGAFNAGCSKWLDNAFLDVWSALPAQLKGLNTWLIGHSYGGATATVLAAAVSNFYPGKLKGVWSYGAPRPGNATFQAICRPLNLSRVMAVGDSVPNVPPRFSEAPFPWGFLTSQMRLAIADQVQPQYGWLVDNNSVFTPTEDCQACFGSQIADLAGFVAAQMLPGNSAHAIANYVALTFAEPGGGHSWSAPATVVAPQTGGISTSRLSILQRRTVTAQQSAIATLPPASQATVFPPPVLTPSSPPYKARKVSGQWGVWIGLECVEVSPGKRRAKLRSRALNKARRTSLSLTGGIG